MTWSKSRADREQDRRTYGSAEYQRNRATVLRAAAGRCSQCGRNGRRLQVDHITPVSQGGTHHVGNLRALCSGPGSCHARKSAAEGAAASGQRRRAPVADPPAQPRTRW